MIKNKLNVSRTLPRAVRILNPPYSQRLRLEESEPLRTAEFCSTCVTLTRGDSNTVVCQITGDCMRPSCNCSSQWNPDKYPVHKRVEHESVQLVGLDIPVNTHGTVGTLKSANMRSVQAAAPVFFEAQDASPTMTKPQARAVRGPRPMPSPRSSTYLVASEQALPSHSTDGLPSKITTNHNIGPREQQAERPWWESIVADKKAMEEIGCDEHGRLICFWRH